MRRRITVKLLHLHAKLERLPRPEAVTVRHARLDCGARHPDEGDAADAVTRHLATYHKGEASSETLHEVAPRLCNRPRTNLLPSLCGSSICRNNLASREQLR